MCMSLFMECVCMSLFVECVYEFVCGVCVCMSLFVEYACVYEGMCVYVKGKDWVKD